MPRRRRGASAMALEEGVEHGLAMRILLHGPKDVVAGLLAFAAVTAIVANALFLQAGQHPSPMFGQSVASPAANLAATNPLPRPRPAELAMKPSESPTSAPRVVDPADPLANLVKATAAPPTSAPISGVPRPPMPIPVSSRSDTGTTAVQGSRRVAAVQRALTEYGYGQLKPTGTVGADTQAAIQKFERARKLPVTGQVSDRLVHELVAVIGHPID